MKLLIALGLVLTGFASPFNLKLPKCYQTTELVYEAFTREDDLLCLKFDKLDLFVEVLAKQVIEKWKSGDRISMRQAKEDQPVVALLSDAWALMAYKTSKLPKDQPNMIRFFSLRCSGSTYLQLLLRHNFPKVYLYQDLGWKHGPGNRVVNDIRQQARGMDQLIEGNFRLHDTRIKDPATIMIVRNPYDWVRSLYKNSSWVLHHAYSGMAFADFLRSTVRVGANQPADFDFFDNKPYANPILMRQNKLKLLLSLTCQSPHHFVINYETLLENAPAVIAHIASTFNWRPKAVYEPIKYRVRGQGKKFQMSSYPDLNDEERAFIKDHLDLQLEALLSYEL